MKNKLARDLKLFDVIVGSKAYGNYGTQRVVLTSKTDEYNIIWFTFYDPKNDRMFRYSYNTFEWVVVK